MPKEPVSFDLSEQLRSELEQIAQRLGTSPAALGAEYVREGVRMAKHPNIELRETPSGRVAYLRGQRLPVWLAIETIGDCGGSVPKAAELLKLPKSLLEAANGYAKAFSEEIEADRIAARESLDAVKEMIPNYSVIEV